MANALVRDAALQAAPTSKRGILERVFARLFEGLVYAQIWEDPDVDLAALELGPKSRVVTIASGGCNAMSYLMADPMQIQAVDLNPAHVALLKLKLTAARQLPDYESFRRLFAGPADADNLALYRRYVAPYLEPAVRDYWAGRDFAGRRRIAMFGRNLYRHGLLGRTIQIGHAVCRLQGKRPARMLEATHASRISAACSTPSWRRCSTAASCGIWRTCRRPISASASRRPSSTRSKPTPVAISPRCCAPRRAARLRLPDPRQLVRLAGLLRPLSRRRAHAAALPAPGELQADPRPHGPHRDRADQPHRPSGPPGRAARSMALFCSTHRTG